MNDEHDHETLTSGKEKMYQLVVSAYVDEFEVKVDDLIHKGWEPLGGPIALTVGESTSLVQAMTCRVRHLF